MFSTGIRIVNLLLHIIASVLLLKLARRLHLRRLTAFAAALLYAVHPLHTEAVIPGTGRGELLTTIFIISGLIFGSRFRSS